MTILILSSLLIGYLLGSIPTAVWVAQWYKGIDIREHGSGNAGLTNVIRVLGWKPAMPVMIVDFFKGWLAPFFAVLIQRQLGVTELNWVVVAAALLAVLGHSFTCFANFRGGKGVLTSLGVFMYLAPIAGLAAFLVWAVVLKATKYMSLASIMGCMVLMAVSSYMYLQMEGQISIWVLSLCLFVGFFVIIKHKGNIKRLLNGTESKMGKK